MPTCTSPIAYRAIQNDSDALFATTAAPHMPPRTPAWAGAASGPPSNACFQRVMPVYDEVGLLSFEPIPPTCHSINPLSFRGPGANHTACVPSLIGEVRAVYCA